MENLPVLERQAAVQVHDNPNFQGAVNDFAASQNNLSAIGAKVAQSASNQMAVQLGQQIGKNPQGDIGLPITDFDKNMLDSYSQQAHATLSIQGQKLMDDAQVQMSRANRLTPDMIAKTNKQLELGLNRIADQAPSDVKTRLQQNFDSQRENQVTDYTTKMIGQQREDQKNNIINGIEINSKNVLESGIKGDLKTSAQTIDSINKMVDNAVANRFITPSEARVYKQTAEQNAINGHFINQAMAAKNAGKYEEFASNYAKKKPDGLSNEQWVNAGQAFSEQIGFLKNLQSQDESIKSEEMLNRIASDPGSITGAEWDTFANSVSREREEQMRFKFIQALKRGNKSTGSSDNLIQNWSNPEAFANASEKVQNDAFNKRVQYVVQQKQQQGMPISQDDAEVQIAASAGGKIPAFVKGLQNKLSSANPAFIESAAQQIHNLQEMNAGHALVGLTDQDKVAFSKYQSLRNSTDPTIAAREMTQQVYNQDPDTQKMNQEKLSSYLKSKSTGGLPLDQVALSSVGFKPADFINPSMSTIYGTDILSKFKSYYQLTNGDSNLAQSLTQKFVDDNYGDTGINGGSFKTLHPLEKLLGFHDSSGVPFIQQDVINHLNQTFAESKKAYDSKSANEYWEAEPLSKAKHGVLGTTYDPVRVTQHMRTGDTVTKKSYDVVLNGNAFDRWDVAVKTDSGMRNLFNIAPYLGVVDYFPNSKSIIGDYNKVHNFHHSLIPNVKEAVK